MRCRGNTPAYGTYDDRRVAKLWGVIMCHFSRYTYLYQVKWVAALESSDIAGCQYIQSEVVRVIV